MGDFFAPIGVFLGYFFRGLLLAILAIVYLPAFMIVQFFTKPWEDMLKEFGF